MNGNVTWQKSFHGMCETSDEQEEEQVKGGERRSPDVDFFQRLCLSTSVS
jgi:hypothetical protein